MAATPRIRIETGPDVGKTADIVHGLVTGRGEECGLVLQDQHCSRQHARFSRNGAGWTVEDLGSTNGVFVNEVQAQGKAPLRHEDRVRVGQTVMSFLAPEPARPVSQAAPVPKKSSAARVAQVPESSDVDAIRTVVFLLLLAVVFILSSEVVRLGLKVMARR